MTRDDIATAEHLDNARRSHVIASRVWRSGIEWAMSMQSNLTFELRCFAMDLELAFDVHANDVRREQERAEVQQTRAITLLFAALNGVHAELASRNCGVCERDRAGR